MDQFWLNALYYYTCAVKLLISVLAMAWSLMGRMEMD